MSDKHNQLTEIIKKGADITGLTPPSGAMSAFHTYYDLLSERGKDVNLTALSGAEDIARLHFLDSIALLNIIAFQGARMIDIGSGAGFPGIPLKIVEPTIDLTLLDSSGKRIAFMSELCDVLNIDAHCIYARAEEAARDAALRASFDVAASRAVAKLNMLAELCLPYVRVGGTFIAMKGADSESELFEAENAFQILGAKLNDCVDYVIPGTDITHRAVIVTKIAETPDKYPRRFARIQKSPL
ncbi:MAG: 16S rRNA (guanine(527)-N(7))-methyltransferase RsmG [Oscillospiraceae bacterium]|nr:16S rRNA (guanine(527)-N(7))-methyltransferase RsmG [Oscillospiraceae bacterium]